MMRWIAGFKHSALSSGAQRSGWIFVAVTIFIDMMSAGILSPVLPGFISRLGGFDAFETARIVGAVGAGWMALLLISTTLQGHLSDRFGRRPFILLANAGLALDYLVMALAPSVAWFIVGRMLSALCAGSYAVASAYVADHAEKTDRAMAFAMFGAAAGAGAALGPAIGGALSILGDRMPFFFAASVGAVNTFYGYIVLKDVARKPTEPGKRVGVSALNPFSNIAQLYLKYPFLAPWFLVGIFQNLANAAPAAIYAIYAGYRFSWSAAQTGLLLAGIGFSRIILQVAVLRAFIRKYGDRRCMLWGLILQVMGFSLAAISSGSLLFIVGSALFAMGSATNPAQAAILSGLVSPSDQGKLAASASTIFHLAGIVAPPMYAWIFASFVSSPGRLNLHGAPVMAAALGTALGLYFAWKGSQRVSC